MIEQTHLFPLAPEEVARCLETASGKKIELFITNNSSSLLSISWRYERTRVRMSKMFLCAGANVLAEIARLIANGSHLPTPLTRRFVAENEQNIPKKTVQALTAQKTNTKGKFFDLRELFDALNLEYFNGTIKAMIVWGKSSHRLQRPRIRTLGAYNGANGKITINPCLDKKNTPRYFLEYVIYHEMLHADIGVVVKNGRRILHPSQLHERERFYKNYEKARNYCERWGK